MHALPNCPGCIRKKRFAPTPLIRTMGISPRSVSDYGDMSLAKPFTFAVVMPRAINKSIFHSIRLSTVMRNIFIIVRYITFWVTLFFLAACGVPKPVRIVSSQTLRISGERPPLDADLAMLSPAGLQGASWINIRDMRRSPLWPTLVTILETHYSEHFLSRDFVLRLLQEAEEILAVSGHRNEKEVDGFVVLIKGTWHTESLIDRLVATGRFRETMENDQRVLAFSNVRITAVTARTLLIASEHLYPTVTELYNLTGDSLRKSRHFSDLQKPERGGAISRYIRGNSTLNPQQFNTVPSYYRRMAKNVERADSQVTFAGNLSLRADVKMDDAEQALQVQKKLNAELKSISSNALIAMLGMKPIVKKMRVTSELRHLRVSFKLTSADIQKILQLIEPLMQIRNMVQ